MSAMAAGGAERVALVTGANKGIGYATAAGLARLGHSVLVGARDPDRGAAAVTRLREDGLDATFLELDITNAGSVADAVEVIDTTHGRLDVLVNNAAVKLEDHPSPPSTSSVEIVRKTFETNVFGTMRVLLAMLPLLQRSEAPRIVNVSSGLGSTTYCTTEGSKYRERPLLSYNTSKAALNSATVQFANELRGTAFKVNVADPGLVNTDMTNMGSRTADDGAAVVIRLATLPDDGPTGCFFDEHGEVPW
jgi:NAD(P)-dependent dehydrogenase (short-subunit alcohol dehydrogenase family)